MIPYLLIIPFAVFVFLMWACFRNDIEKYYTHNFGNGWVYIDGQCYEMSGCEISFEYPPETLAVTRRLKRLRKLLNREFTITFQSIETSDELIKWFNQEQGK